MTPIEMDRERQGQRWVLCIRLTLPRRTKALRAVAAANQLEAAAEAMRDAAREGDVVELIFREDPDVS